MRIFSSCETAVEDQVGFRHKFACAEEVIHARSRMPLGCREFCAIQKLTCSFKQAGRLGSTSSKVKTDKPSFTVPEQSEVCGVELILFKVKIHEIPHIGDEYLFSLLNRSVNPDKSHSANFFIKANYTFAFFR